MLRTDTFKATSYRRASAPDGVLLIEMPEGPMADVVQRALTEYYGRCAYADNPAKGLAQAMEQAVRDARRDPDVQHIIAAEVEVPA